MPYNFCVRIQEYNFCCVYLFVWFPSQMILIYNWWSNLVFLVNCIWVKVSFDYDTISFDPKKRDAFLHELISFLWNCKQISFELENVIFNTTNNKLIDFKWCNNINFFLFLYSLLVSYFSSKSTILVMYKSYLAFRVNVPSLLRFNTNGSLLDNTIIGGEYCFWSSRLVKLPLTSMDGFPL